MKELLRIQRIDQSLLKAKKDHKFYDPSLDKIKKKKEKKKTNAFVFVEKGSFIKNKKQQTAKKLGIDLNKTQLTVLILLLNRKRKKKIYLTQIYYPTQAKNNP